MTAASFRRCADVRSLLSVLLFCFLISLIRFFNTAPASPVHHHYSDNIVPATTSQHHIRHIVQREEEHYSSSPTHGSGMIKRSFDTFGSAAYLFIKMGGYRGGAATFAVVGLGSKPLHVYSNTSYLCEWRPHDSTDSLTASGVVFLPDWGYGHVYTVVVVNCTFPSPAGADGSGGRLLLRETTSGGGVPVEELISALEETPGSVNSTLFRAPPRYECVYCGSPLYGDLNPQRIREWVAYHVRLFGERSHIVLHDAGGVHEKVMEVLRPWMERGSVTLYDVRGQERFDGYYHNQFLVVNDCLFRHRLAARWIFFFDVDEFLYVDPSTTLPALLQSLSNYTQFTIEQMGMSSELCSSEDAGRSGGMWGMEKLVYRKLKTMSRKDWDRKYAIQPMRAMSAGVHLSEHVAGEACHQTEGRVRYLHYHGTVAEIRGDPCKEWANETKVKLEDMRFVRDDTLRRVTGDVKEFERRSIGSLLERTQE